MRDQFACILKLLHKRNEGIVSLCGRNKALVKRPMTMTMQYLEELGKIKYLWWVWRLHLQASESLSENTVGKTTTLILQYLNNQERQDLIYSTSSFNHVSLFYNWSIVYPFLIYVHCNHYIFVLSDFFFFKPCLIFLSGVGCYPKKVHAFVQVNIKWTRDGGQWCFISPYFRTMQ